MQKSRASSLSLTDIEVKILLEFFPQGICAFDLEMTGLSPMLDKIIEIAAYKLLADGSFQTYHSLVNPLIPIPPKTIAFHGLTNDILRTAQTLKKPLTQFLDFYQSSPLIAHNAMFDIGFLIRGIHEHNFSISLSSVYDSCKMARNLFKKHPQAPENSKLATLATYFEIDFDHHQALDDAIVCLKIYARCLIELKTKFPNKNNKELSFLFKLNSFQKCENYLLPNKLSALKEYIPLQQKIFIKYKGGSYKGEFRPIKPISLLPMPQGLILYAQCLHTDYNKYFQIKKIQSLTLEPK
ncbi:MAG: 3'-5' exonuclease [Halobacteriovoraceae bacterium]|jgi:DNA polymerase III subunit epsilon|nr:3'-5' exonuclease [Halobacteriovoraceae bacterium]